MSLPTPKYKEGDIITGSTNRAAFFIIKELVYLAHAEGEWAYKIVELGSTDEWFLSAAYIDSGFVLEA